MIPGCSPLSAFLNGLWIGIAFSALYFALKWAVAAAQRYRQNRASPKE
jgi:hypothetical protein